MSRTDVAPIQLQYQDKSIFGRSHVGAVRDENQDFMGLAQEGEFLLLCVLDGMGGHSGGYEASRIATRVLIEHFSDIVLHTPVEEIDPASILTIGFNKANQALLDFTQKNPGLEGMGTTVVCAIIHHNAMWIAHIGDSRAHIIRDNNVHLLTIDHTVINQLARMGDIPIDKLENHHLGHILERSLGTEDPLEIDVTSPIELQEGDRLILSSDGFWQYSNDDDIQRLLHQGALDDITQNSIEHALKKGGSDNITITVLHCTKTCAQHVSYPLTKVKDARIDFHASIRENLASQTSVEGATQELRIEYVKEGEFELPPPPQKSNAIQYLAILFLVGTGIVLYNIF